MLSLEDAKASAFRACTQEELHHYCAELGIQIHHRHKPDTLRDKLCAELGIVNPMQPQQTRKTLNVVSRSPIFPPYNLTGNGRWEGRRHRMKLHRPDGVKIEVGKLFNAGGVKYGLRYGEVENVPEPVYLLLNSTKRTNAVQTKQPNGEINYRFEQGDEVFPYSYLGVDPETADRAGSLVEWYQAKGPKWFHERNRRELEQLSKLTETPVRDVTGVPFTDEILVGNLLTFFFGYSDAEEIEMAEEAA